MQTTKHRHKALLTNTFDFPKQQRKFQHFHIQKTVRVIQMQEEVIHPFMVGL
jgi:hypothetical protein